MSNVCLIDFKKMNSERWFMIQDDGSLTVGWCGQTVQLSIEETKILRTTLNMGLVPEPCLEVDNDDDEY